jgi:hypothetical protein
MQDAICPNCGEYIEGCFEPSDCPRLTSGGYIDIS